MSCVAYTNESRHTYKRVTSHMNASCHTESQHAAHERVMSHMWMSHVTHMNESWHTSRNMQHMIRRWHDPLKCVTWLIHTCDIWMRLIYMYTYEWVMAHRQHMNETCHTYEWVMSHIWMSHGTQSHNIQHMIRWWVIGSIVTLSQQVCCNVLQCVAVCCTVL